MTYRVLYTAAVLQELDRQIAYFRAQHAWPGQARTWLLGLLDVIDSLERFPARYPVMEKISAYLGCEVRRMQFGEYWIYYRIDEEHKTVAIDHFRHSARREGI